MANIIEFNLSNEDRARLDKIIHLLSGIQSYYAETEARLFPERSGTTEAAEVNTPEAEKPAEHPKTAKETAPEETSAAPDLPWETDEPEKAEPSVDLAQIQQKVVQLCALGGGVKKAAVRGVINQYGTKVSDLKDMPDKWAEIWDKLVKLEKEV
jgi:hypothetical protein